MPREVNLFFSQEERDATSALRSRIAVLCKERNWNYQARLVPKVRTPDGRPMFLIPLPVAAGLYPRVHRHSVATLVIGTDPVVPLHPIEKEAIKFRRHVPLRQFLDYKTCWLRISNEVENNSWVGVFESWANRVECEGEHDPRCLPFHVFSAHAPGLSDELVRQDFDRHYGAGASRTEDEGATWRLNPRDYHSNESLTIAGHTLRPGCHWDVEADDWRIETPVGVWRVNGHVNVYPDAFIRPKGNNVRKLL